MKQGNPAEELVRADDGQCIGLTFDALKAVRSRMDVSLSMGLYDNTKQGIRRIKGISEIHLAIIDAIIDDPEPTDN